MPARPPGPPALAELQALVDDLADELGRSVVINDPVVRMLCTSRHFGDEDEVRVRAVLQRDAGAEVSRYVLDQGVAQWTRAGIVPGRPGAGMRDRLCVPLRAGERLVGLLMVIDAERTLTPGQLARIEGAARTAAALLDPGRTDAAERAREHLVERLLGDDPDGRRDAAREAGRAADPTGAGVEVRVTVLDAGPLPQADAVLRTVLGSASRHHPHRYLGAVGRGRGALVRVGAHPGTDDALAQAERMVVAADRLLGREGAVVAGLGGAVPDLGSARRSHAQAVTAARGARLLPGLGPVVRWEALGPYAVVLRLPDPAAELVPAPLERLLGHRSAPRLVETLRAFLDHAGSMPRTAEALHLHRTSLYYRLDRIAEITGLDLDDGRDRLLLHLGLLVLDLGGPGAPGPDRDG